MKIVKLTLGIVLAVVLLAVALLLALPLWIGPVARSVANAVVPKKTGTEFTIGEFALNPYAGRLALGDVRLANPEGFKPELAVEVKSLKVEIDASTALSDVVVVKDITLDGAFVSYVMGFDGVSNFGIIKQNATGDCTKGEPQAAKGEKPEPKAEDKDTAKDAGGKDRKVIIDHLLIKGVKVQFGPIPMPMPPLEISGIGRKSMGVTIQEAGTQIYDAAVQKLNAAGVNVSALVSDFGNLGAKGLGDAARVLKDAGVKAKDADKVMKVLGALRDAGVEKSGGALDSTVNAAKGVGTGAGKVIDGTGDAVRETGKAILNIFGK